MNGSKPLMKICPDLPNGTRRRSTGRRLRSVATKSREAGAKGKNKEAQSGEFTAFANCQLPLANLKMSDER
jgi:hypothetical protein